MGFEEAKQRREEHGFAGAGFQLLRPDSGQSDEPLRPAGFAKRCRKSGERKRDGIIPIFANQA